MANLITFFEELILNPAIRTILVVGVLAGAGFVINRRLLAFFEDRPLLKFRRQILQLAGLLTMVLLAILFLPFTDEIRSDLLGLFGLVVSAAIALSSTTLVGNVMAGIMLKTVGNCGPGDYITVGGHFGRITEMDLLHTEIQTEQRDLTTLPNLYMVTNPVRVMRASGTVLTVDLSLGYDVSRHQVEQLLVEAATATGLESPYVQIRELGDFSVTYSVSGLLTDINQLLAKRRDLRGRTIDTLHAAGIEIVSPTFMNTRVLETGDTFISDVPGEDEETSPGISPDAVVFDKAEKAESVARLRTKLEDLNARLKSLDEVVAAGKEAASESAAKERESTQQQIERLKSLIERKEARISEE